MKVTHETMHKIELTSLEAEKIISEINGIFKKCVEENTSPEKIDGLLGLKNAIVADMEL